MRDTAVMIAAATVALTGCDNDHMNPLGCDGGIDASASAAGCWPELVTTPRGSAVLGTGRGGFEPMPEVLPLEYGTQDGYNLVAHVRMSGFEPGDPKNIYERRNPRTRIRAYFDDTGVPLNFYARCPFRNGYIAADDGGYELGEGVPIIFETCWRSNHLFGARIRIELELMDDAGGYTKDVRIVTAAPPTSFYPDEQGAPPCEHRFVPGPALQDP
ncbi:MAG: hypothetical protein H0X17_08190 [Deltaproteobacteria bacterium]|nr:hypothetical protein [Deltaproteobacteria bacterium]